MSKDEGCGFREAKVNFPRVRSNGFPGFRNKNNQRFTFAAEFHRKSDAVFEVAPTHCGTWNVFRSQFFSGGAGWFEVCVYDGPGPREICEVSRCYQLSLVE